MGDHYDLTDGGRRKIINADQAASLRERQESSAQLELFLAKTRGGCSWPDITARIDRDEAMWDQLGEGSQDVAGDEPA